mgnify:CR=1 FL=1|jgi:hypothetical protein
MVTVDEKPAFTVTAETSPTGADLVPSGSASLAAPRLGGRMLGLDAAIALSTGFALLWAVSVIVVSLGAMALDVVVDDPRLLDVFRNADLVALALALPGAVLLFRRAGRAD